MTRKILIVEDQADIRKLIRLTLSQTGFTLYEAENGDHGWQLAQELRPDVVLLDVMMPGRLDGLQVCTRIKADTSLAGTRVVMLTARSQGTDIMAGFQCGAEAYLSKPFSPLELLETVEQLVGCVG